MADVVNTVDNELDFEVRDPSDVVDERQLTSEVKGVRNKESLASRLASSDLPPDPYTLDSASSIEKTKSELAEQKSHRVETAFGLSLALFAAVLAVNDLGAGRYGDEELQLSNEKTSAYLWYQSKGIKESLAEGQRDLLKTLIAGGAISGAQHGKITDMLNKTEEKLGRYRKEKREILLGSSGVGKENWVQDVEGKMGQVVGAKELEARQTQLGKAGDRFDLAALCLQLSLVLGAVGLVIRQEKKKMMFLAALIGFGLIGAIFSVIAYYLASLS